MDIFNSILNNNLTSSTHILEILAIIFGTFFLSLFIGFVYKKTYTGKYYNPSFVQTIIILSVLIAIVMMIVGQNAAGAFTLMWALSIVRFRNSLKDIRDIGFILFAIAIGMAMGTKLFLFAIIGTISVSLIFTIISHFQLFQSEIRIRKTLKIQLDAERNFSNIFAKIFEKHSIVADISGIIPISIPTTEIGVFDRKNEIIYTITHPENFDYETFLMDIETITYNKNITILEA